MKSSPKKSRTGAASPQKQSTARGVPQAEVEVLHEEVKNLQFQLGDRDTEIERMKTTLIALNHKLAALSDVQKEIDEHKTYFKNSEDQRGGLQTHIVELSQKIKIDSETHEAKHDQSLSEIEKLREEIQALKRQLAEEAEKHRGEVEGIN